MDLDDMMGSKVRRKIIRVLWKVSSTNMMDLVRRVNSTYNQVVPHLQALEKEGIISEERFGRVRMIKLERENPKTNLLLQALKILDKDFTQNNQLPDSKKNKQVSNEHQVSKSGDNVVLPLFQNKSKEETKE